MAVAILTKGSSLIAFDLRLFASFTTPVRFLATYPLLGHGTERSQ